ncbi:MAG: ABC transporter ATP-binding protein [Oscillospiraceae bacterium]|nr:ABC transporter ATP-binding protein [Oscillospiraceae bacterium]
MWKKLIAYYKPHRLLFALDMAAAFIVAVCDLFYPVITRGMINDYIPNRQMRTMLLWAGILIALYIVKALLSYFMQYYGHLVGVRMQAHMRRDVFTHLQKLPFQYFDGNKTGTIMSRIVGDLMDISELAHHGPEDLFISLVLLIGSFVILCSINVWLTLIIFCFIPVLVWIAARKRVKLDQAFTDSRVKIGEVNADLENSIAGIRVSKAFGSGEHETEKFQRGNMAFVESRARAYQVMAEFFSSTGFIQDLLNAITIVAGGVFWYYGKIDVGDFTAYLLFIGIFLNPIKKLVSFVEMYQSGMTGFKRFLEIMAAEPEQEAPGAAVLGQVKGEIDFKDVTFVYDESKTVLSHVDLHIGAGRTVALVGPSGGGKTTLCHLLPRFYDVAGGVVSIDGQDVTRVTYESLRRNIGIVQQEVFLFTGTIRENIAYGNLEASDEQIVEAAKKARIHDYVMTLPEGYDTYVGERGMKLSGGQKQRIAIARLFLKNPPILILDEATSALDNVTELQIQQSLDELCHGRTTLVVAHRLSTIKNADEIVVLTDHGVEERGTHAQLLEKKDGIYRELYDVQFKAL